LRKLQQSGFLYRLVGVWIEVSDPGHGFTAGADMRGNTKSILSAGGRAADQDSHKRLVIVEGHTHQLAFTSSVMVAVNYQATNVRQKSLNTDAL
jgi:hypothetical protein